jgi:hypothetical protein
LDFGLSARRRHRRPRDRMGKQTNGPARTGAEPGEPDLVCGAINPGNSNADAGRQRRLKLFTVRCEQMASRVRAGAVPFVWGVDTCYEASIWAGLNDDVGDDAVQAAMSRAFMGLRRP